jgi:Amt family ammonium transporter
MAADWNAIARIATTTNTAAAAAAVSASIAAWLLLKKPDLTMILNGSLAGLVAITAPCAFVSVADSLIIGLGAGVLVVLSVLFFDRIRVDDPVGAISVHLMCGVFGTLMLGLLAQDQFMPNTTGNGLLYGGGWKLFTTQLIGVAAVGVFAFGISLLFWAIIKATVGLRVGPEEELEGLDIGEHGISAYPEFHIPTMEPIGGSASRRSTAQMAMAPAREGNR